jgi:hypothetical protein
LTLYGSGLLSRLNWSQAPRPHPRPARKVADAGAPPIGSNLSEQLVAFWIIAVGVLLSETANLRAAGA